MDLLRKARDLEAKLAGRLDRTVAGLVKPPAREPLEIVHAVIENAHQEIQSGGRGRRIFPFNAITLTLLAPSREVRARFEALFADSSLHDRIAARLAAAACRVDDLEVMVLYESKPRKHWRNELYDLELARVDTPESASPSPAARAPVPRIEITVVDGTAERRSYALTAGARIDIGRCAAVRDNRHRLIRTNHVAFLERAGDVNQSVSRRHAHIAYESASGHFRLHDDGSEHGTGIVRLGRTVPVPRGARGVRLESGDEIVLGDARLRIKFAADPTDPAEPAKPAHHRRRGGA